MDGVEQSQEEEVEDTISPTARSYRPTVAYTSSGRRVVVAGGRTVGRSDTSDASAPLGKKSLSSTADDVASKGEDLIKEAAETTKSLENSSGGGPLISASGKQKKGVRRREAADKTIFPNPPSVPGYAMWLQEVMRVVMDGCGDPIVCMEWGDVFIKAF